MTAESPVDLTEVFRLDLDPAERAARELSVGVVPGSFGDPSYWRRFTKKIDASGGFDACWPWLAYRQPSGYGRMPGEGSGSAHRLAFAWALGPIEPGLVVRHAGCGKPSCVNPRHLAQGTHKDNAADMVRDGNAGRGRVLAEDDIDIAAVMIDRLCRPRNEGRDKATRASILRGLARELRVTPQTIDRALKNRERAQS